MQHLRTLKDIRIFILLNVVIYIIHVMSCIQETSGLFLILYVYWETNTKKVCQFSNVLCHAPVFVMKMLKEKRLFPGVCRFHYICDMSHNTFY